jgi:hypothetical protein
MTNGILGGEGTVGVYYEGALKRARDALHRLSDKQLLANSEQDVIDKLVFENELDPLLEDPERDVTSDQEREFRTGRDEVFDRPVQRELIYARIEIPLVPTTSNEVALRLRGQGARPVSTGISKMCSYDSRTHRLVLRVPFSEAGRFLPMARDMIKMINDEITQRTPEFRKQVSEMVRGRRSQVAQQQEQFAATMETLGVSLKKNSGAVTPVNVQVKRTVQLLREPLTHKPGPTEPHLTPETLDEIVGLLDQAGRGFETAPATFGKFEEEDLRNVLLGYLNAVFMAVAATGETFSKRGKTDIFLRVSGGAVLIAECKFWGGAKRYGETLEQLFRYLTWRHTSAVVITFVRNRNLTNVLAEADRAVQDHSSYREGYTVRAETYRTSAHQHPEDHEKTLKIHHLFFHLATPEA